MERLFRQPPEKTQEEILHEQTIYFRVKKQIAWKKKIDPQEKKIYDAVLKDSDYFEEIKNMPDLKYTNSKISKEKLPLSINLKIMRQLDFYRKRQKTIDKIVASNYYTLKNRIKNGDYLTDFK